MKTYSKHCGNLVCGKSYEAKDVRSKYCTRTCAAIVNNSLHPKRHSDRQCTGCGKFLVGQQRLYCSRVCQVIYEEKQRISSWLDGKESGSCSDGTPKIWVRRFLLREANFACSRCGWGECNPKLNLPILTIDHIDGNWQNNQRENLVVLCYNCHTLTPTFGSLNKNNVDVQMSRREYEQKRALGV